MFFIHLCIFMYICVSLYVLVLVFLTTLAIMSTPSIFHTSTGKTLKFFKSDGFKISSKLEKQIESIVLNEHKYSKIIRSEVNTGKAIRLEDASGRYSEFLKSTLDKNLKIRKLKIVLDCGNGATYNFR